MSASEAGCSWFAVVKQFWCVAEARLLAGLYVGRSLDVSRCICLDSGGHFAVLVLQPCHQAPDTFSPTPDCGWPKLPVAPPDGAWAH